MDRMKKLLMMDSRTFNRLTTPKDKVLTSIEGEMSSILNDESIPEDVRAKLYSSAQSRFLKIEHPQWSETTSPPNVVPDNQRLVERVKPVSNIFKTSNRISLNDKRELPIDSEDVPLWTPNDFLEKSSKLRSNAWESSEPPAYGTLKTPEDFIEKPRQSKRSSRYPDSRIPSIYVTPGYPQTPRRKKIKFDTLYK